MPTKTAMNATKPHGLIKDVNFIYCHITLQGTRHNRRRDNLPHHKTILQRDSPRPTNHSSAYHWDRHDQDRMINPHPDSFPQVLKSHQVTNGIDPEA
jgi:hypothetical protein